jgi:hypothetical protein
MPYYRDKMFKMTVFWKKNEKNGISFMHHDIPLCVADHEGRAKQNVNQLTHAFLNLAQNIKEDTLN